jgi:outer membrane protein
MKAMTATLCLLLAAGGAWAADTRVPASTPPAQSTSVKPTKKSVVVVIVDVSRIARESNLAKSVQAEFQAWGDGVKVALQPKSEALRVKQEALKTEGAKLTADQKQVREKEIATLQLEMNQMQQKAQQEYQQRQQGAEERLRAAFEPVLDAVAKENGWDVVLNKADRLLWTSEAVDQTEQVLTRFNAAYTVPPPATPAAKPAK